MPPAKQTPLAKALHTVATAVREMEAARPAPTDPVLKERSDALDETVRKVNAACDELLHSIQLKMNAFEALLDDVLSGLPNVPPKPRVRPSRARGSADPNELEE
jgi:hypothetical protein